MSQRIQGKGSATVRGVDLAALLRAIWGTAILYRSIGRAKSGRRRGKMCHKRGRARSMRSVPTASIGTMTIGARAIGASAFGACAVAALAIRKLAVKDAAVARLDVRELKVGRLEVDELVVHSEQRSSAPPTSEYGAPST